MRGIQERTPNWLRRSLLGPALCLLCLSVAVSVQAQSAAGPEDAPETTYNFEDDLVTGDLVRPDGERLMARRGGITDSLITIREHFIPEMLKSVEDL